MSRKSHSESGRNPIKMGFFRFLYRRVAREKNAITKQIKKSDWGESTWVLRKCRRFRESFVEIAAKVGDVIRKQGLEEPEVRRHFMEEMCDVMMYFNDLMNCFGISSDELAEQYRAKHRRNMTRR